MGIIHEGRTEGSQHTQWEFYGGPWRQEEINEIEAILQELMEPDATNLWRLRKSVTSAGTLYSTKRLTWTYDSLRGDTIDELANELRRYYKKGQ